MSVFEVKFWVKLNCRYNLKKPPRGIVPFLKLLEHLLHLYYSFLRIFSPQSHRSYVNKYFYDTVV